MPFFDRSISGQPRNSSSGGYSADTYFSRNAMSASNFMPRSQSQSSEVPADMQRPYSGVGKFNINLMGQPVTAESAQHAAQEPPFQGVPVLGFLGELASGVGADVVGAIGRLPIDLTLLGGSFAPGSARNLNIQAAQAFAQQKASDFASFKQSRPDLKPDIAVREFYRQSQLQGPNALLTSQVPAEMQDTLGGSVMQLLEGLNLPQTGVVRGLAGTGSRLKDLDEATDSNLEFRPDLISIRDRHKAHQIDDSQALDQLTQAGYGITNPLGQSEWAQTLEREGGVPGRVIANIAAAALSLGLEVFTDPTNIVSFGTAGAIKMGTKGAAKILAAASDDVARTALADAAKAGVLKGPKEVAKGVLSAPASDIDVAARRALDERLLSYLPEGVQPTPENIVRFARRANDPAITAHQAAAGTLAPLVTSTYALDWVNRASNALDPLTLFGKMRLGKAMTKAAGAMATDGFVSSLGRDSVAKVFKNLTDAGVEEAQLGGDMGHAIANVTMQIGGEMKAREVARFGGELPSDMNPVMLTDMGTDMIKRAGSDINSLVKHKVEKKSYLVLRRAGESQKEALVRVRGETAALLVRAYGITEEAAKQATRKMSESDIKTTRWFVYGRQADELLTARGLSREQAAAAGISPDWADRFIFLGPTQLTKQVSKQLKKAAKKGRVAEVRAAVQRYDELEYNIPLGVTDDELLALTQDVLDGLDSSLPSEYPVDKLTPAMREFRDKYGGDVQIGLRPEDVFATVRNHEGRITSANPFMDYVRGSAIELGDVPPPNLVSRWSGRLSNQISGAMVVTEQRRRLTQRLVGNYGMSAEQADAVFGVIRRKAQDVRASSARGLSAGELWEAAGTVKLPKSVRQKMTENQLRQDVFWAWQGSLGRVGLTQSFTGLAKRLPILGEPLGMLAERIYPHVRFSLNPFFQFQESIEAPILLTARGYTSPMYWIRAMRETPAMRDLQQQTAVLMDTFAADSRYAADMAERSDIVRYSSAAAGRMASTTEGRMLTKLQAPGKFSVARIKARAQTQVFRQQMGEVWRMLEQESPVQARALMEHYGTHDRGEAAIRWANDLLARNDPKSAFSAIDAKVAPGEFFRPSFLGKRTRWDRSVAMYALSDDMPDGMTWRQLRRAYNSEDAADAAYNPTWLEDTLRARGADEHYIQRTKWHLTYETEKEFEEAVAKVAPGGEKEAASIMEYHRDIAQREHVPLIESLADKYASSPTAISADGKVKGNAMFQLIADANEARGVATVARDAPELEAMRVTGDGYLPDFSLSEAERSLAWEDHPLARHTELVPLSRLIDIEPGNAPTRLTEKEIADLGESIRKQGQTSPVQLTYSHVDRTVRLDEGNHRIEALRRSIPKGKTADDVLVPTTVITHRTYPANGTPVPGALEDEFKYVSSNLKPSEIGLVDRERAEFLRYEQQRRTAVDQLTDAQKKGRAAKLARSERVVDPTLGLPPLYEDLVAPNLLTGGGKPLIEGGRLVFRDADGNVVHRIGGKKTPQEWMEELRNNFSRSQLEENSDWYLDMRRGFLALTDNQQEEAAQLLVGFAATQLNTSPVAGMRFLYYVVEQLRVGNELPTQVKALQKAAGLNGANLKNLFYGNYLSSENLGQKLVDFADSLLGNRVRSIPVSGPQGRWMPVAGDIWAKRDAGYLDTKMESHLQYQLGPEYKVKATDDGFDITMPDGSVTKLPASGQNPTDLEYDALLEFYNEATDLLNEQSFLGRTDWTAAEAQALGWFKGKKVFNDDTGDPRSAFFDNAYQIQIEVNPKAQGPLQHLYPELDEEYTNEVAQIIATPLGDEAAYQSGTRIISMNGGVVRHSDGRLGSTVNFEVAGSPNGADGFMGHIGVTARQSRVRAVRATTTQWKPTNNVHHHVDLVFPESVTLENMRQVQKALAEDDEFFGRSLLIRNHDGSFSIRVVAEQAESLKHFQERMPDTDLRALYESSYDPRGYARGRYVSSVEEDRLRTIGEQWQADGAATLRPLNDYDSDPEAIGDWAVDSIFTDGKPVIDNGGSISLQDGKVPKAAGGNEGGPYATAITPETRSLPPTITPDELRREVANFVEANRALLEQDRNVLGIFYNNDTKMIELDVNKVVPTFEDAESMQLVLNRPGGAYDFTTGNGVFSPQYDPDMAYGIVRGRSEVRQMSNDWDAKPGGEGYLDELTGTREGSKGEKIPRGYAAARRELERDGRDWSAMVWEDAYGRVAARETAAHRTARLVSGAPEFDPASAVGHLANNPRGTRSARLAVGEARRGVALFQRPRGGAVRGAITGAGTTVSEGGPGARVYVHPKRRTADTLAHEYAHDFVNRMLQPSAKRRVKALYAGREGNPPIPGRKGRDAELTVDEQEWLANQLVEYLRQGENAVAHPSLRPLARYYSETLRANKTRGKLSPEAKSLFDELDQTPMPKNGYGYDVDEQAFINWLQVGHRRADRASADLVHFATERSWLERSLNHPYFGLYPLSYMWGKILPEMVEFLAFRPFGMKTPLVALDMVNTMYQHMMTLQEMDPELANYLSQTEDAWRAVGMLIPGLPWDLPVNAPNWLRRYIEQASTNVERDRHGETPEDLDYWNDFVTGIGAERIYKDSFDYAFGPVSGGATFLKYPGLVADVLRDDENQPRPQMNFAESEWTPTVPLTDTNPGLMGGDVMPQAQSGPVQPAAFEPPPPQQQPDPGSIAELEQTLGEEYAQVVEAIGD